MRAGGCASVVFMRGGLHKGQATSGFSTDLVAGDFPERGIVCALAAAMRLSWNHLSKFLSSQPTALGVLN